MATVINTLKLMYTRDNGIDITKFEGEFTLTRCSNVRMARCVGRTYTIRLVNGRLSAMDINDPEGDGGMDFHTTTVLESAFDPETLSLVVKTRNSIYEFKREA